MPNTSCCMLSQNGVVDCSPRCSSHPVATASAAASSATLDTVNCNSVAVKQRPGNLEILSKDSVASMNHRNNNSTDDDIGASDGSPPDTPDSQGAHIGDGMVDTETRSLINGFLTDFTGMSTASWKQNKTHSTMKRVVANVLEKYKYKYNGIINKLSLDDRGDDMGFVSEVAKSLFSDGTTNWGRVASLVAFGAVVSQYLKEKGRGNCVALVAEEISSYLLIHQRNWLMKNNSWDGFVEFFREANSESTVRNALMAFAGVAGIGATLALLIRISIFILNWRKTNRSKAKRPHPSERIQKQCRICCISSRQSCSDISLKQKPESAADSMTRSGCGCHPQTSENMIYMKI